MPGRESQHGLPGSERATDGKTGRLSLQSTSPPSAGFQQRQGFPGRATYFVLRLSFPCARGHSDSQRISTGDRVPRQVRPHGGGLLSTVCSRLFGFPSRRFPRHRALPDVGFLFVLFLIRGTPRRPRISRCPPCAALPSCPRGCADDPVGPPPRQVSLGPVPRVQVLTGMGWDGMLRSCSYPSRLPLPVRTYMV